MIPAEELRAAAKVLRETASNATPGPWTVREGNNVSSNVIARDEHMVIDGGGWTDGTKSVVYGAALNADAAWIALASPALAEPLAAWLESTANYVAHRVADPRHQAIAAGPNSLAVARTILGGAK